MVQGRIPGPGLEQMFGIEKGKANTDHREPRFRALASSFGLIIIIYQD